MTIRTMKKLLLAWIMFIFACAAIAALGRLPDNTKQYKPVIYGGSSQDSSILIKTVTANDTMLDVNTKGWKTCKEKFEPIPPEWSIITVSVYAYDANAAPDGNTGTIYIYGCEYLGGARLLDYGNFTIGSVKMSHNPVTGAELNSGLVSEKYQWADTYTSLAASTVWPTSHKRVSGSGGSDPNGNIMSIWIDRMNLYGIYADVNNATFGNGGGDLTSVTVVFSGVD